MLFSDGAATRNDDLLRFDRYVVPLARAHSDETTTPLTIGVYGAWGSGKSTLIKMLDEYLGETEPDGFVRVHFNPWVHRQEEGLLIPLLHALHDTLAQDRKERFKESAKRIWNVGARSVSTSSSSG